jgi:three-Cys-motif partner protein
MDLGRFNEVIAMWKCLNCDVETDDERADCRGCGLIRIGPGTKEKYGILAGYLPQLSLIMRNQGFEHYFIDACAGSGTVMDLEKRVMMDGSPLIMAKTRQVVDERIRDKTTQQQVKCVYIEYEDKTFAHLKNAMNPYSNFTECISGDCNNALDSVLDRISSEKKSENHFAFVYIDPFGLGTPTIQERTLFRVLERPFTELLIHFSWEGVSRLTGYAKNVDDPSSRVSSTARAFVKSLTSYLGEGWQDIERQNLSPVRRRNAYVDLYVSRLKEHYRLTTHTEIPMGNQNPNYFLIFATRNGRGFEIMRKVIMSTRLKGAQPLEAYQTPRADALNVNPAQRSLEEYWS